MKKLLCVSVGMIAAVCLFSAGLADAEELTGYITQITGTVEISQDQGSSYIPAVEGIEVSAGDIVRTGEDGSATLVLMQKTSLNLPKNTTLKVTRHMMDDATQKTSTKMELLSGKIRAIVDDLPEGSTFEVKTGTSVAAVRGTIYSVGEDRTVCVKEGSVTVTDLITGETVIVYAGEILIVSEEGDFEVIRDITPERWAEICGYFTELRAEPYEDSRIIIVPTPPETGGEDPTDPVDPASETGGSTCQEMFSVR